MLDLTEFGSFELETLTTESVYQHTSSDSPNSATGILLGSHSDGMTLASYPTPLVTVYRDVQLDPTQFFPPGPKM